jgi:uncharacterized RDD family membrane protein YckC
MDEFWIVRGGKRSGPYTEAEVLRAHRDGALKQGDRLWARGVSEPVGIAEVLAQLPGAAAAAAPELTLDPIAEPHRARYERDASPYRPPQSVVDADSAPRGDAELRYAGFWVRFAASMLDTLVVLVLVVVLGIALGAMAGIARISFLDSYWASFAWSTALIWLYLALGESGSYSATLGKRAFHLQVLGADFLDRISFLRASARFLGRYLSSLPLVLGYLMQPFNARKRALHDFLCGTVVVVERQYSRLLVAGTIAITLIIPAGLVAFAYPYYRMYVAQMSVYEALRAVQPATTAVARYVERTGEAPVSLEEAGFAPGTPLPGIRALAFDADSGIFKVTLDVEPVRGDTLFIAPMQIRNDEIGWECRPGTLRAEYLPPICPPQE